MTQKHRFQLIAGIIVALVAIIALVILNHPESDADSQQTDDAYIRADFTTVAPQISGVIEQLAVRDNQTVHAGDLLLTLDPREFQMALDNARADVASAQASIESLKAQITRQQSLIDQSRAALAASSAQLRLAENDKRRYANLARDGSGTLQARQQADAQWSVQQAAVDRDTAALLSSRQQTAILDADLDKATAALSSARAKAALAELNLSRTRVTAPITGVVTQRRARTGGYAGVGEPLVTLVPLQDLYVEANFRETQIARMRPGQPVVLSVDALPGSRLKGHVESLGPASGVSFSSVPAHNATGNFTKIVQRLPIRIALEPGQKELEALRVGMSVRPSVMTVDQVTSHSKTEDVLSTPGREAP